MAFVQEGDGRVPAIWWVDVGGLDVDVGKHAIARSAIARHGLVDLLDSAFVVAGKVVGEDSVVVVDERQGDKSQLKSVDDGGLDVITRRWMRPRAGNVIVDLRESSDHLLSEASTTGEVACRESFYRERFRSALGRSQGEKN